MSSTTNNEFPQWAKENTKSLKNTAIGRE